MQARSAAVRPTSQLVAMTLAMIFCSSLLARADVKMHIAFGFNGHFMPDHLTPVRVTLTNTGSPVQGRLEIGQNVETPLQGSYTQQLRYPIELDSGTQKTFEFPVFVHGYIYPLEIRLRSGDQLLQAVSIDLREAFVSEKIVLGLGNPPLPSLLPDGQTPLPVSYATLPTDWAGYDAVQRIYLGRLDTNLFTKPQQEALQGWLLTGGELVILGGEDWRVQRSAWLEDLMPLTATRIELHRIGELESPVVVGTLRGQSLREREGLVLVARQRYGLGRVVFFSISPLRWPELWSSLQPEDSAGDWFAQEFSQDTASRLLAGLELPQPSRGFIALVLGFLVAGFGLFSSWMTRRPARGYFVAIIALVLSAAFVLWIYVNQPVYSSALHSLELSVERNFPDAELSLEQRWFSLYTRRGEAIQLRVPGTRVREILPRAERPDDLVTEPAGEDEWKIQFFLLSQKRRHFLVERVLPRDLRLSVNRSVRPAQVTVYNGGPADLVQGLVIVDGAWYRIGTTPAGQAQQVALMSERRVSNLEAAWSAGTTAPGLLYVKSELYHKRRVLEQFVKELGSRAGWVAWSGGSTIPHLANENRLSAKLYLVGEERTALE